MYSSSPVNLQRIMAKYVLEENRQIHVSSNWKAEHPNLSLYRALTHIYEQSNLMEDSNNGQNRCTLTKVCLTKQVHSNKALSRQNRCTPTKVCPDKTGALQQRFVLTKQTTSIRVCLTKKSF
ncbi:hypothetical protein BsWGS_03117 [Bradybaena similaris]